jgi:hypothetical protein
MLDKTGGVEQGVIASNFWNRRSRFESTPGADPTTVSYNASVVKILQRSE